MKEIWKDIEGYEGYYQVSTAGRVRALERNVLSNGVLRKRRMRYLSNGEAHKNYYKVMLSRDGIHKTFLIHQLVAKAFIPNPNGYRCINHKDENGKNNVIDNLEWCSQKYNINYGTRTSRMKITKGSPVLQYDLNMNLIAEYYSQAEAARLLKIRQSAICMACNNKKKGRPHYYKGYYWYYKNE